MKSLNWLLWLLLMAGFFGTLASMKENVSISFNTWNIDMSFGALFFALFVIIVFFVMIDRLIQNLSWFERWQKQRRMRKARAIMLQGFGHLAARDIQAAQKASNEVDRLWDGNTKDPFKLVFEGRLAEQEGAWETAQQKYDLLQSDKETKLYALRSQLRLAYTQQNDDLIQKLTARALKMAPEDLSLHMMQLEAATKRQQWSKSHRLLHKMEKSALLSADMAQHKKMEIYLDEAEDQMLRQNYGSAKSLAQKAIKIKATPQGHLAEIEALIAGGHRKAAIKHLQTAWQSEPDRMLLPVWEKLAPDSNKLGFYEAMLQANAQSPLTHAALIRVAAEEGKTSEARAYLDALERNHFDTLEFAESREQIARHIDHDRNAAEQWKNRADTLRMARRALAPQTMIGATKSVLRDPLE